MKVEELDETFADDAAQLWQNVGLTRPWNDPREDFERALRGPSSGVLGAIDDDELIGTAMVGVDGHRGWVYYVAVAPSYQGRGVGRELMRRAEQWLVERDAPKVQLMVRDTNEAIMGFYEQLGYDNAHTVVLGKWLGGEQ
jgi:ribosomal protein S18 acetylase RimI-like enzyme